MHSVGYCNKQQIWEMGALGPLVRLLKNENAILRGKACQILSSLTEHGRRDPPTSFPLSHFMFQKFIKLVKSLSFFSVLNNNYSLFFSKESVVKWMKKSDELIQTFVLLLDPTGFTFHTLVV